MNQLWLGAVIGCASRFFRLTGVAPLELAAMVERWGVRISRSAVVIWKIYNNNGFYPMILDLLWEP